MSDEDLCEFYDAEDFGEAFDGSPGRSAAHPFGGHRPRSRTEPDLEARIRKPSKTEHQHALRHGASQVVPNEVAAPPSSDEETLEMKREKGPNSAGVTPPESSTEPDERALDEDYPVGEATDQPMPPMSKEEDVIVVNFGDETDKFDPHNWNIFLKLYMTVACGMITLSCSFTSSAPSFMVEVYMKEFSTTKEVSKAMIFLYVLGFCLGPLVWGPLSEVYGRYIVFLVSMTGFTCFNVGCALAKNVVSMIFFRILAGSFAASTLTNAPAVLVSIWDANKLGIGLTLFCIAPMAGPALGPIAGGFILNSGTSWNWLFWICTIFSGACTAVVATLPETLEPLCLLKKAKHLRQTTGDQRYKAVTELQKVDWAKKTEQALLMPFKLFFFEPMLIAVTLYISFVYGVLYLLFEAFPAVYMKVHGMNPGDTGLTFLGYFSGTLIGALLYAFVINPMYSKKLKTAQAKHGPSYNHLPPEERLLASMIGGPVLLVALFWFAWTSFSHVTVWAPIVASAFIGFAILVIFLSLMTYITETYVPRSASAVAANTVVRSSFGVGFPMFAEQMYDKLNPRWASTLLAFITLLLLPLPFLLTRYGALLCSKARYAYN